MSTKMQAFYNNVVSPSNGKQIYPPCYAKLTQADPEQLQPLQSGREWTDWGTAG